MEVVVHEFKITDSEDPDLLAAEPLYEFEQSSKGKWVLENATDIPIWTRSADEYSWGWSYKITADFNEAALTEWMLRYGSS